MYRQKKYKSKKEKKTYRVRKFKDLVMTDKYFDLATVNELKKVLWDIFSKYIRIKDSSNGFVTCFTCGKRSHRKEQQAGHFISRRHNSTMFDEDNVKPQCIYCNVHKMGMPEVFAENLGKEEAKKLEKKSQLKKKFTKEELKYLIEKYQILFTDFTNKYGD